MSWLGVEGRTYLVCGCKNKRSIAWHVGARLEAEGAQVLWSVRNEERAAELRKRRPDARVLVCDVEEPAQIEALGATLEREHPPLAGLVHSLAFADYSAGPRAFHELSREAFLRSLDVSCYSLIALCGRLEARFEREASVVALSISSTRMAAENYGAMGPVKAALDSAVVFLAKSLKARSGARCNAVGAGLLKTSASAGIPGYVESLLFAEQATLRKRGLTTEEVADVVLFLLSPRSAGIDAQRVVVDAGMGVNYFDRAIVEAATRVASAPLSEAREPEARA